jgi:hypothetical protein
MSEHVDIHPQTVSILKTGFSVVAGRKAFFYFYVSFYLNATVVIDNGFFFLILALSDSDTISCFEVDFASL